MQITVAIPVYNRKEHISECIDSVLKQKENSQYSYSVLVIDNSSTDGTIEILQEYSKHKKVTVIYNSINLGMAGNWTKCYKESQGDYTYLLHSDDLMLPNTLSTTADFLFKHPECDFGFGNVDVNKNNRITKNVFSLKGKHFEILDNNWLLNQYFYRASHPCPPQTWFIRKGIIEKCGGFIEETICCDFNMSFKIVASSFKIGYINKSLSEWIIHDNNAGGGDMSKHKEHLVRAIEEIKNRHAEYNLDELKMNQLQSEVIREEAFHYLKFGKNKIAKSLIKQLRSMKVYFKYKLQPKDYLIILFEHTNLNLINPLYKAKQFFRL
ncbi:glycosyltransferase family 2 protein [Aureibaculum luteum]|uniref:glycosyltransferase family 2 protein n=1 Tax=Aureibaculum luteum TaxID=1548456 RepID=UPI000E4A7948|nr:glycosyltransferase [Aureibaculum luteum]